MNDWEQGQEPDTWVRILRGGVLAALSPDGREGYRVRAWPDLTPETWDPGSGCWRPDFAAAEALNEIFKVLLYPDVYAEPYLPDVPRLASVPGGWAIRSDGQRLMPFWVEGLNDAEEVPDTRKWEMLQAFKATLPGEVRDVLAEFPRPPFEVLRALALAPGLLTLARRNFPVLWMLARTGWDGSSLRELARVSRRDLMGVLGLPPAAFGFLARLPRKQLRPDKIRLLADAVTQPVFGKMLHHLHPVPPRLLPVLEEPQYWELLTPALLHQLRRYAASDCAEDCHQLDVFLLDLHQVAVQQPSLPRRRLRSMGEAAHLNAVVCPPRPDPDPDDPTPLPVPPVPGSATLVPIRTLGEAAREGHAQGNCVGTESILGLVREGKCALYRSQPSAPLRVTVLVESFPGESPVVKDVRGPDDVLVGLGTLRWVAEQLGLDVDPYWLPGDAVFLPPGATCAVRAPADCTAA
jgi:hypothetical protein